MVVTPNIPLKSGYSMPQVGFGLLRVPTSSCADIVYDAIKEGYRLFDGAFDYGNEKEAGVGIKRAIDEGLVKREDLFITSKLWNTFHEKGVVEPIVRQQLNWWGLDYFDLFLMHYPISLKYVDYTKYYPTGWLYHGNDGVSGKIEPIDVRNQETWEAMESLVGKGLVRSIGASNFQGSLLIDTLRYAKVPISVLQIEHHPYLIQPNLISFARQKDIVVTASYSFGPRNTLLLEAKNLSPLSAHSVITDIAKNYSKTSFQVLLRWATQRGLAVIPEAVDHQRLVENLNSLDFELGNDVIDAISGLDQNLRANDPGEILSTFQIFA